MKIIAYLATLFITISLVFLLPRFMPGDPLAALTGEPTADVSVIMDEETRDKLLAYYDLDRGLGAQYISYLTHLAQGDLGWSIYYNAPVLSVLLGRLKWTLLLLGTAMALYVPLGIALGALSAWWHGSRLDVGFLAGLSILGSMPSFFLAMILILFLGVRLNLFPICGAQTPGDMSTGIARVLDILHHMVLPTTALVLTHVGGVYYLMRNSMISVLGEDYILVARAKGLPEQAILYRHALRNALLPVVTLVAMRFGFLVMGTIFVEVVFAYPGMGTLLYQASMVRDYPLLQGAFLLLVLLILTSNLSADLLYARLDPRVSRP
ncbi:MAG: ABC transporter permease [Anaerolineae bacterium]|nr:ABC transporter permease [Anaerolineae bacterium]